MGSNVFANGMEIASVASDGKSIAAMPDVCYTPPQAPPTPTGVPVPYPNTGMASDLTGGSTSVMIGGNPACLKDKSSFKKTSGDEAGSAPLKGLVSMSNAGAVFFAAWSMDVKIEGENVVRNLDIGTHNHASDPGNAPPWPFAASASAPPGQPPVKCGMEGEKRDSACSGKKTKEERCDAPACRDDEVPAPTPPEDKGKGMLQRADAPSSRRGPRLHRSGRAGGGSTTCSIPQL